MGVVIIRSTGPEKVGSPVPQEQSQAKPQAIPDAPVPSDLPPFNPDAAPLTLALHSFANGNHRRLFMLRNGRPELEVLKWDPDSKEVLLKDGRGFVFHSHIKTRELKLYTPRWS